MFQSLTNAIKGGLTNVLLGAKKIGEDIALKTYNTIKPQAKEVSPGKFEGRVNAVDVAREAVSMLGQGAMRSYGSVGKAIETRARKPQASFSQIASEKFVPTTDFEKFLYGDKPFSLLSEGEDVTSAVGINKESPLGKTINPFVGFGLGIADLFTGGEGSKGVKIGAETLDNLVNARTLEEAKPIIESIKDVPSHITDFIAEGVAKITGKKEIQTFVDTAVQLDKDAQIFRDAGYSAKDAFDLQKIRVENALTTERALKESGVAAEEAVKIAKQSDEAFVNSFKTTKITTSASEKAAAAEKLVNSAPETPLKMSQRVGEDALTAPRVSTELLDQQAPTMTFKQLNEVAQKIYDNDPVEVSRRLFKTEGRTALDNEISRLRFEDIQRELASLPDGTPVKQNLIRESIQIVENVSKGARSQGQAVSSLRLWAKNTPEAQVVYLEDLVRRANELLREKGSKKVVTASEAFRKTVFDEQKRIMGITDEYEKLFEQAKLNRMMEAEVLPRQFWKQVSTTQTMFQLINPKTYLRNMIGNAGFAAIEKFGTEPLAAVFDSVFGAFSGRRSVGVGSVKEFLSGFNEGMRKGIREALANIQIGEVAGRQFELPNTPVFKIGSIGEKAQKLLNLMLRGPDRAFFQASYADSIYKQMKAMGTTELTNDIMEEAYFDALYKTFQDDSNLGKFLSSLKNNLNSLTGVKQFGLGDILIKYPRTPANLINRGLAYSPAGFMKGLYYLYKTVRGGGGVTQKRAVEALARATIGTSAAFGIGATLYKIGAITTTPPGDRDLAQFQKEAGFGQYRLNVDSVKRLMASGFDVEEAKPKQNDLIVSYDWFQPFAVSLALGADFEKNKGADSSMLGTLLGAVNSGMETIAEQPLLTGITNYMKFKDIPEATQQAILTIPSTFVPTLLNQTRQLIDDQARSTYSPDPVEQYAKNLTMMRIPGLSQNLPPRVTLLGEDSPVYGATSKNNIFNVFFNPAFVSRYKLSPEEIMVINLVSQTGDNSVVPRKVSTTAKINGENIKISSQQYHDLQQFMGRVTRARLGALAADQSFAQLAATDQVKEIRNDLSTIYAAAKIAILGDRPSTNKVSKDTWALLHSIYGNFPYEAKY